MNYDDVKNYLNEAAKYLMTSMHSNTLRNEYREILVEFKNTIEESEKEAKPLDENYYFFMSGKLDECAKIDAMITEIDGGEYIN